MAAKSKLNKGVFVVLIISVLIVIASASPLAVSEEESLPIAREKRTITVIARGLANIFGLELENGQSSTGVTNPSTSNPLIITYPPIQRVPTQPYQKLTYPTLPTTTPSPTPVTYHPAMTIPPPTTRPLAPKQKEQLSSSHPVIGVPTSRPAFLTPKRLITLRPPPLSPTRIITSRPLSITTYSQTERIETESGRLDAKKEVVLIGIPVTIHKLGGLNLGLFSGGNDGEQLKQFQNAYDKKKAKDIESVEQTKKVKENSYKSVKDLGAPNKDENNVGLVDSYDEYKKRITNKLKTQGSSEESNSNNYDYTTSSAPYKYDEFDIPDVASQDVGNHQESDEYSDKENERETWKFYREESKNARPPVQSQQVQNDSEGGGTRPNNGKEHEYDDGDAKHEDGSGDMEYERFKNLTIMKVNGRVNEPKNQYQDSDENENPSYKGHRDFEHQNYNDDDRERENESWPSKKERKKENEGNDERYQHEGTRNDGYRNNLKGRDSYQRGRGNMEDNIGKHRDDDRVSDHHRNRGHVDEDRRQDNRNQYKTSNGDKGQRNKERDQALDEGSGETNTHEGHGEFDYGVYKDDLNHKEGDDFNHNFKSNKDKKPQINQENLEETDEKRKHKNYDYGRNNYDREKEYRQESKNRENPSKTNSGKPHRNQENLDGIHKDDSGYGHSHSGRDEKHEHGARDRHKTPKDEKRNDNSGQQQDNGEDQRHVDHISWDYGHSGDGRDSKEKGFTQDKTHHDGWKHQESQPQNSGTHSHEKDGPFNYEPNSWDVHHNPWKGNVKNGSSPGPENSDKGKPEHGSGPHHDSGGQVFDYEQYTKNHGVHGFRFPSQYENIHAAPDNFWGPAQSVGHEKYIHHSASPAYQPQLYSYETPGYFGPLRQPGYEEQGHSFGHDHFFNPHHAGPKAPRPEGKGPQRRTEEFKSKKSKSEVDELASDGLASEMQREVPARGSRPKKSHSEGNGPIPAGQIRKEVKINKPERKVSSTQKYATSNSYPSPSRPRAVLQAIQQIENNRQPQLWPSPYDASFDSSRRVTVSTPHKSKNPIQKGKSESDNPPQSKSVSTNLNSRNKNQVKSKFEPFKTKANEKVELTFGWPKSFLKKDAPGQGSPTQSGRGKKLTPTYTKNLKTSYQADAELYDFGKFNKNTGHYDVQGSSRNR